MKATLFSVLVLLIGGVALIGCQKPAATDDGHHDHGDHPVSEAEVQAALAKLSPEDRKLAAEQGYCANEQQSKLGSMGTPLKVIVKGRPAFVCCESCSKRVLADPDRTLAAVDALRAKTAAEHKEPHPYQ